MTQPQAPRILLGEKTSVSAARILREQILSGQLEPGQVLGEQQIGQQFGISRTPVREALVLLRGEGLVETPANRPAIVRAFTAGDLREMYSLRAVLEGYAARIATSHLTDAQLDELAQSCDRYRELGRHDDRLRELTEENFTFHTTIHQAAESALLLSMIRQVTAVPLIYRSYLTYSEAHRDTAWQDHVRILDALRARDPDRAEGVMKAHVLWARDVALTHLALADSAS